MVQLNRNEMTLYSKQILLSEVGMAGQLKLKQTKLLCIGAGGLASPLLQYMAAAGVGKIGIIDDDLIEMSNLQRQVIYSHEDIGIKKVVVAKKNLFQLNPHIQIDIYPEKLTSMNAHSIIKQYDMIADCTDQLLTSYIINQVCVELNKPFVFAGISQYQGQCMLFHGQQGPCFCCLFPFKQGSDDLLDCNIGGVLGILPGLLGMMQANLLLQFILELKPKEVGRFYLFDLFKFELHDYTLAKREDCLVCGEGVIPSE